MAGGGMSLRDWFAGQALSGFIADKRYSDVGNEAANVFEIARACGNVADAMLVERAGEHGEKGQLSFQDAAQIARGCLDYGGGYRNNTSQLEAFHHGIQTVINALEAASKAGLSDTQVAALHSMGGEKK
jgi:hypothetical protein